LTTTLPRTTLYGQSVRLSILGGIGVQSRSELLRVTSSGRPTTLDAPLPGWSWAIPIDPSPAPPHHHHDERALL